MEFKKCGGPAPSFFGLLEVFYRNIQTKVIIPTSSHLSVLS